MHAKNINFPSDFLCSSLFSNVVLHTLYHEDETKTSGGWGGGEYREMFSYQFVARMPKLGKSEQK